MILYRIKHMVFDYKSGYSQAESGGTGCFPGRSAQPCTEEWTLQGSGRNLLIYLKENLPLIEFNPAKKVGNIITKGSGMRQKYGIFVIDFDKKDYMESIDLINRRLIILDENDNDIVRRYGYDKEFGRIIPL